ncbi:MAG: CvpA family protein [Kiritimatiellales bacterium]
MGFPEQLYTIDILFSVFVLLFVFSGIKHGLSGELAHVITLAALLTGVCFYYPQLTKLASETWRALPESAVRIAVPVVMLLIAILFFVVVRALFKQLFKSKLGEPADKIAGGLVGALRGALFGLAILVAISLIPNNSLYQTLSEKSSVGAWVCNTLTPWSQSHMTELPVLKDKMSEQLNDITP